MKLIRAMVRPEREHDVVAALERAGLFALTKMDVLGRGRQGGIRIAGTVYDEIPKVEFLVVVEDGDVESAIEAFATGARTGHFGDGMVFISPVERAVTVRTGESFPPGPS